MIKTVLVILLGLFFVLNGLNHLFNSKTLSEWAEMRGLFSPLLMVRISGVLLIFGGFSLATGFLKLWGIIGLAIFLVLSSVLIHHFWTVKDREERMIELTHFAKNLAILTELLYLASDL